MSLIHGFNRALPGLLACCWAGSTALVAQPPACTSPCDRGGVYNTKGAPTPLNTGPVIYADAALSQGEGICTAIISAVGSLSAAGGVIDARGYAAKTGQMVFACNQNPFKNAGTKVLRLLLGPYTIQTSVTWPLPAEASIAGQGTVLQATGKVQAVVTFGSTANVEGISLEDLTVDCGGTAQIGVQNQLAGERTTLDRVTIKNCIDTGLEVTTPGSRNSGPFRDLHIVVGTGANVNSKCVRVGLNQAKNLTCGSGSNQTACMVYGWRGIEGMTCENQAAGITPNTGVDVAAEGGSLRDVYVTGFNRGLRIGANPNVSTSGMVVENVHGTVAGAAPVLVQLGAAKIGGTGFDIAIRSAALDPGFTLAPGTAIIRDLIQGQSICPSAAVLTSALYVKKMYAPMPMLSCP